MHMKFEVSTLIFIRYTFRFYSILLDEPVHPEPLAHFHFEKLVKRYFSKFLMRYFVVNVFALASLVNLPQDLLNVGSKCPELLEMICTSQRTGTVLDNQLSIGSGFVPSIRDFNIAMMAYLPIDVCKLDMYHDHDMHNDYSLV